MSISSLVSWRRIGLIFAALAFFIWIAFATQINGKSATVEKFEWYASESAAKEYPIELVRADLVLADGASFYVPDKRTVSRGWGQLGSAHVVGDDQKALPTRLDALWFSYIEDTFYEISFDLPAHEMLQYFETGFESPQRGEKREFKTVLFGFGPEGEGAIWLNGHANTVRVATFKGEPSGAEWKTVIDNPDITRETFIALVLNEAMTAEGAERALKKGYTEGTWHRRQQRFDWSFNVEAVESITSLKLDSLNGEKLHFFDEETPVIPRSGLGIPDKIVFQWIGKAGEKRHADITFDSEESIAAFEKLAPQSNDDLRLNLEVSASSNGIAVSLQTKDFEYEFEKASIDIFSM